MTRIEELLARFNDEEEAISIYEMHELCVLQEAEVGRVRGYLEVEKGDVERLSWEVYNLEVEVKRLQAIVEKLPINAEGRRVVPGVDPVWCISRSGETKVFTDPDDFVVRWGLWQVVWRDPNNKWTVPKDWYSTKADAEAAREDS